MRQRLPEATADAIVGFLADRYGFRVSRSGTAELGKILSQEAKERSLSLEAFAEFLLEGLADEPTLDGIAEKLTVGESYFFRHPEQFAAAEALFLRRRISEKTRSGDRSLRIWSAACSTGEEAYSLAIAVARAVPDFRKWDIEILGTDLNPRFLDVARTGEYGEWSFRGVPEEARVAYFEAAPAGSPVSPRLQGPRLRVRQDIRDLVRFSRLNLKSLGWLIPGRPRQGFDMVFCRNVLIYFDRTSAAEILWKIRGHMAERSCLVVSPSELAMVPQDLARQERHKGCSIFLVEPRSIPDGDKPAPPARLRPLPSTAPTTATSNALDSLAPNPIPADASAKARDPLLSLEPRDWYRRALEALERKDEAEALSSLVRTLYLDPDFIPAHIALGNIARREGREDEAVRQFSLAHKLLEGLPDSQEIEESGGMGAKALRDMVASILQVARGG